AHLSRHWPVLLWLSAGLRAPPFVRPGSLFTSGRKRPSRRENTGPRDPRNILVTAERETVMQPGMRAYWGAAASSRGVNRRREMPQAGKRVLRRSQPGHQHPRLERFNARGL